MPAAFLLSLGGLACCALSMEKDHDDVFGRSLSTAWRLAFRVIGWGLLAGSLASSILRRGISVGIVEWFAILTVAGLTVALLTTYLPRAVPVVAFAAPAVFGSLLVGVV